MSSRKHVFLISFPTFGHITPMLELARKMADYHYVTFAVSVEKAQQMLQKEIISHNENITIFPIQDGFQEADHEDPGFGAGFQVQISCLTQALIEFSTKLRNATENDLTISSRIPPVDMVIADNFVVAPLITKSCVDNSIPLYHFNTAAAGLTEMYLMVDENYPTLPPANYEVPPFFGPPKFGEPFQPIPVFLKELFEPVGQTIHLAKGVIANTVREIDEDRIAKIMSHSKMKGLEFLAVGPLFPLEKTQNEKFELQEKVTNWLDSKEPLSVVYISFGSLVVLDDVQLTEMALALLELKKPFIWSLPKRVHQKLPVEFHGHSTCFLLLEWAPQKLILSHPSTAVFVSHCGWNGTLEGLFSGVPFLCWPMCTDQLQDATWLAERGVGVLVEGTGLKATKAHSKDMIMDLIKRAACFEKKDGETTYRETARLWAQKLHRAVEPGGSSYQDFMKLVQF